MRKVGLFIILGMIVLLSSCKKSDTSENENKSDSYYYEATIGGVQYKETIPYDNNDPNLVAGSSLGGTNEVIFSADISNYRANGSSMDISKGLFTNYLNSTEARFKSFFAPGNYNYSRLAKDGVSLRWTDKNGTEWSTDLGTGNQAGSTFRIVDVKDEPEVTGRLYIKTTIEFNCKLYDGNGNVKQAVGKFVGLFGMI